MKGIGTKDEILIRIIVSRSEVTYILVKCKLLLFKFLILFYVYRSIWLRCVENTKKFLNTVYMISLKKNFRVIMKRLCLN